MFIQYKNQEYLKVIVTENNKDTLLLIRYVSITENQL